MAAALFHFTARAQGVGRQSLQGHVPPAIGRQKLQPVNRLPATNRLNLAIGLPLRNQEALNRLLLEIYDPSSTNYHRYLTPEQFTAQFGPTEQDYQSFIDFAKTNGLTVAATYPNRVLLDVSGSAATVEHVFHVTMGVYQHPVESRTFYAPDAEPSVDCAVPVLHVSGLDNYFIPRPANLKKNLANSQAGNISPASGSGPSGNYMGNDFRAAYVPGTALNGAGQSVGLLELDGYLPADIAKYETMAGLPSISLTNILIDGYSGYSGVNNGEVALDIEMAISMATNLSQVVVYEALNNGNNTYIIDMLNRIASDNTSKQISSSWLLGNNASFDTAYVQMALQGQSFFQASGDDDAYYSGIAQWADDTNITLVGGTTLSTTGPNGSWSSETVWNWGNGSGSGGGVNLHNVSIPGWQLGVSMANNQGSTTLRNVPDVALTADNIFVVADTNKQENVGGTSCAAPLWAAFTALVNQQAAALGKPPVGFLNPAIYAIGKGPNYATTFHDIATGNNFSTSSLGKYSAVTGYDLCTGWGTPNGQDLINALVPPDTLGIVPVNGFVASGLVGGPFSPASQNFTLTNSGASSIAWSLINTASWLGASATSGTLAAGATSGITISVTAAANNLAVGNYVATMNLTNWSTHVVQYLQFTLQVQQPLTVASSAGFTASGPVGGPFNITNQNFSVTNAGSLSLNWSLISTSAWLTATGGGALAAGATGAASVGLNSAANSLAAGNYAANVWFTNQTSGGAIGLQFNLLIGQPLVQNGGFEAGNFTGWTQSGNTAYTTVISGNSSFVHSGAYGVEAGPASSLGYLSQTLPTSSGQKYLLSLWMNSPNVAGTMTPNEFSVSWNGSIIYDKTNIGKIGWTNLQFTVTATSSSTALQIGLRDDPYYLGLDDVSVTPIYPPVISTQPTNLNVIIGTNAVFSATVSGSTPLVYQWRKNGTNMVNGGNISGATTNVLTFTAVVATNAGNYTVVITNTYGSITSSVAALTIAVPPSITSSSLTNQTVQCGLNTNTFAIITAGTAPLGIQWSLDAVLVGGATNSSLSLTNLHSPNHTITVVVTNLYGTIASNAVLTVQDTFAPAITLNGSNPMFIELGGTFTDPGAMATDLCAGAVGVITSGSVNTGSLGTNTITYAAGDGNGNTNSATRSVIVRDTTPPTISWSFTNLILAAGTNCNVVMTNVTGTNFILATDLSGALAIIQIPTNTAILPLGTNVVVITVKDSSGNAANSTNTIVVKDQTPPVFLIQPQSRTNIVGTAANFSAGATACTPVGYQWLFNSAPLAGQTNSALTNASVSTASAGNYSVIATASGGSTTSAVARLTVNLVQPSLALYSSANPAGYHDNLSYTAFVTPTNAGGNVQFFTNGFLFDTKTLIAGHAASASLAILPRGTNPITAIYSGDLNDLPATNSLEQIVTNHPPLVIDYHTNRFAGLLLDIPVASLSSNWSDVDGDTVTLAAIGVSTNGVTVTNSAGTLIYWKTNDVDDKFICTVTDSWGGTNIQNVYLTVVPLPKNAIPAISSLVISNGKTISLNLDGASGFTYVLETTTNLSLPGAWLPIATNLVGPSGIWQFSGAITNSPHQFYRLMLSP